MGQASTADREGFWRERVAGWKRSGVSQRIDSERHSLKAGMLGVWSSKLKGWTAAPDETAVQQEQAADMPFVPVGVVEMTEATPTAVGVLVLGHVVSAIPASVPILPSHRPAPSPGTTFYNPN